jgi:hypothetical protein
VPTGDWNLLDEALATALELPGPDQLNYLRKRLASHPDTLRQAECLLAQSAEAEAFFENSPVAPFRLAPGLRLGPWRLERELGRGGMGAVWLARRADGEADMLAAIKFLNTPFATPALLERFHREKQILARLRHPHIAQMLDAGIGPGDVPNFVLEFVDGPPVTEYCTELPQTARVRMARQILDALQHAHVNLVVHRDLKPGNILCTTTGSPKLLDFGIARLVVDTGSAARTETLYRALSIDYASPEQIRGEPVSTASDLYSFGLVLYEMWTGQRPRSWSRRPLAEVLSGAVDFRLPSHPALPADLSAILARATDPEPARRYSSASEFSADLGRFLDGLPVTARPASVWYLASRYLRRHALASTAVLLALTGIVGGAVTALYQAREADRQRILAVERQREAEAAAREAVAARELTQQALTEAHQQRTLADQRRDGLLQLSYSFVDETYRDIANLPGATPIRAQLLARTLEHLERLQDSSPDEPGQLMVSIDALGNLSDTYGGENANLGNRQQARVLLQKRARLIDRLSALQPGSKESRRLLVDNRLRLAIQDVSGNRPAYEAAIRRLEPEMDRLVASTTPTRPLYRTAVSFYFHRARIVRDQTECLRYYERVAALAAEDERRFGGDDNTWRSQALAWKYAAGLFPAGTEESYKYIQRALPLDQKRVALNPANAQARLDLTFDQSAVASYYSRSGRLAEARDLHLEVFRQRSLLVEIDPANQWYRNSLWYPLIWSATYSARLQDWPALDQALTRSEVLAASSRPPVYVTILITYLRGERLAASDPVAACAHYREAGGLLARASTADQRQFGPDAQLRQRLAACAENEKGSAPAREAP